MISKMKCPKRELIELLMTDGVIGMLTIYVSKFVTGKSGLVCSCESGQLK